MAFPFLLEFTALDGSPCAVVAEDGELSIIPEEQARQREEQTAGCGAAESPSCANDAVRLHQPLSKPH